MITSSSTPILLDEDLRMSRYAHAGLTEYDVIQSIEAELKKRLSYPASPWGQKQTDRDDLLTNGIYVISKWDGLMEYIKTVPPHLKNYTVNRWFNFWSARGVEMIFCSFPQVEPNVNKKDRLVDFTICGVTMDHKTSVWPRSYPIGVAYAKRYPERLAQWLYDNQSDSSRKHYANRLFIVLCDGRGQHWRLRADLTGLYGVIERYVNNFDPDRLLTVGQAKSDVIFFESRSNW